MKIRTKRSINDSICNGSDQTRRKITKVEGQHVALVMGKKGRNKKNITYYIYDLMKYGTIHGTILTLFSNVTYHDKNVSALWHDGMRKSYSINP